MTKPDHLLRLLFCDQAMEVQRLHVGPQNRVDQCAEVSTHKAGRTALKIRTDSGWKTIDSVYDPVEEARGMIGEQAGDYLMLGAGSGYVAQELLKSRAENLLIITGSRMVAEKNQNLLQAHENNRVQATIISADGPLQELFEHVRHFIAKHQGARLIIHPGESKAFPRLFNPLLPWIAFLRKPFTQQAPSAIHRILFPQQGQIIEPDVQRAFEEYGIEVIARPSCAHTALSHVRAHEMLSDHAPDMVFSLNNRGSDRNGFIPELCSHAGIAWATWFLDQPSFLVAENECRAEQRRIAFCWDTAGIAPCEDAGFSAVSLLPLAANHRLFTPGQGRAELEGRLVYVGSPSFGNEERYFASLRKKPEAQLLAEILHPEVAATRTLPKPEAVGEAMRDAAVSANCFTHEELRRLPAFILFTANLAYRRNMLNALADFNPIVFGDGWQGLLSNRVTLLPYADYYRHLPDIYRSDAVHLSLTHLQMRTYPNQRIFDAGACGSVVVGERLPGCGELFGKDLDSLFYTNIEALRCNLDILLKDKKLRREIGETLRNRILAHHTYAHRIATLLARVKEP